MLNIRNFEKSIDSKIVECGYSYYKNSYLEEVELVDIGEYSALVLGSEEYSVYIRVDTNDEITEHTCTCPYDWGEVCKHRVAVLYNRRNNQKNSGAEISAKTIFLKQELASFTKEELKALVFKLSKQNRAIRDELLWELGYEEDSAD
jgi:uncharacterized Zn finger protein